MRHKLVAFGAFGSALVVLPVCGILILCSGLTAWFLAAQPVEERITRIFPVIPLSGTENPPALENPPLETAADLHPQATVSPQPQLETLPTLPLAASGEAVVPEVETAPVVPETGPELLENEVAASPVSEAATRLIIPKLNLDTPVVRSPLENESWKVNHLTDDVGHLEGTAVPGSNGNVVLAGHVTLDSGVDGPFIGLSQLAPDDVLYIYQDGQQFQYVVIDTQTVDRAAVEVTYPTGFGQLTLITCSNWNNQENRYLERLIVKGHLVRG